MVFAFVATVVALGSLLLLWRVWCSLPGRRPVCPGNRKLRCLVVLGSGGHTAEMLYDLASLAAHRGCLSLTYLIADTDRSSQAKAEAFEAQHGEPSARVVRVPRAREVGQSYVSSIFTSLRAAWFSLTAVLREPPDIVFANGPGTCVPVAFAAYVAKILGLRRVLLVYSESFACVEHLSLSGRLLYHFADCFTVQWPQLLQEYPKAEYAGRLYSSQDAVVERQELPPLPAPVAEPRAAIVTVGSTKFDALIRAVDSVEFLTVLRELGIQKLKVQRGAGQHIPANLGSATQPALEGLDVEVVEYTMDLPSQLQQASLVISHAGAGTILDCLMARRRLVVVPNEGLMANHQVQLGMALQEQRLLFCFRAHELVKSLKEADFASLRRFPEQSSTVFAKHSCELLGLVPS